MSTLASPCLDPEEARLRKMSRRSKVIQELVQTERDFLTDMELCVREVVKPLRESQVHPVCARHTYSTNPNPEGEPGTPCLCTTQTLLETAVPTWSRERGR